MRDGRRQLRHVLLVRFDMRAQSYIAQSILIFIRLAVASNEKNLNHLSVSCTPLMPVHALPTSQTTFSADQLSSLISISKHPHANFILHEKLPAATIKHASEPTFLIKLPFYT